LRRYGSRATIRDRVDVCLGARCLRSPQQSLRAIGVLTMGEKLCGSSCIAPLIDNKNCGACGATCSAPFQCVNGGCNCPAGQTSCGGTCADLNTSNQNCGAGGGSTACKTGQVCSNSSCVGSCASGSDPVFGRVHRHQQLLAELRRLWHRLSLRFLLLCGCMHRGLRSRRNVLPTVLHHVADRPGLLLHQHER
jgi:hypothetical protein